MKKISVDIDDVATAMQHREREISEEYLDTFTGDVINMPQDVIDALEGDSGIDAEDLSDW